MWRDPVTWLLLGALAVCVYATMNPDAAQHAMVQIYNNLATMIGR